MTEARQNEVKGPRYFVLFSSTISFAIAATGLAIDLHELDLLWLGIGVFCLARGYRTLAIGRAIHEAEPDETPDARFDSIFRRTAQGYGIAGVLCAASTAVSGEWAGVLFGLLLFGYGALAWFAPRLTQDGGAGRSWPGRWFP